MFTLSKIAIQYPGQCAWWIYHFLYFDQDNAPANAKRPQAMHKSIISRADFARSLLGKIMG